MTRMQPIPMHIECRNILLKVMGQRLGNMEMIVLMNLNKTCGGVSATEHLEIRRNMLHLLTDIRVIIDFELMLDSGPRVDPSPR